MKAELLDQQVLAMYDVRGIQSYIFKSNAAKEIVGAGRKNYHRRIAGICEYTEEKFVDLYDGLEER